MERARRHKRIRNKILGTVKRPRLVVYRSLKYIYVQLVNDMKHNTLVSANSLGVKKGTKTEKSKECGKKLAELAKKKKIKTIAFDRSGYKYHGRVKALADGAREGGLKF
ncbi:50S ribosomal protein L18 [candidate division WOR-3 bacterium]|nr:50S ribosomal protein L18 [candidate division WOR-3 bacterium]